MLIVTTFSTSKWRGSESQSKHPKAISVAKLGLGVERHKHAINAMIFPTTMLKRGFCLLLLATATSGFSNGPTYSWSSSSSRLEMETKELVDPILDISYSKNPLKRVRHFLGSLKQNSDQTKLHDAALKQTGGVWKTKFLGRQSYGVTSYLPEITNTMTKAEAQGFLVNSWPQSVIDVLGPSSLIVDGPNVNQGKKVLMEALSTKSIMNQSLSGIQSAVDSMFVEWKESAKVGETRTFASDISNITYKVILAAVFGSNGLSESEYTELRRCSDQIVKGLFAVPIDVPILRELPFFRRYPRAMQARRDMKALLEKKVADRRLVMEEAGESFSPTGMLDAFLVQGNVMRNDEMIDFCVDNVILSIFAGYDTTASVTTNLIFILSEYAQEEELSQIRQELETFDFTSLKTLPSSGILDAVPSLKSAVYESFRFRTVVGSSFRKTTAPITVGKVEIPAGKTVQWSLMHGSKSEEFFDEPEKACPLRFLSSSSPLPYMFGYGKHACPGSNLAQIEILLTMKAFLCNFDYTLEKDQDTSPSVPFSAPKSGLKLTLKSR